MLLATVLDPATSIPIFDAIDASFNRTEADLAWGSYSQNFGSCVSSIRKFLQDRPAAIESGSQLTAPAVRTTLNDDDCKRPFLVFAFCFFPEFFPLAVCFGTPKITSRTSNAYRSRPGRPLNLRTTAVTDTTISLTWNAPNPNGNPLVNYVLERRQGTSGTFASVAVVPAASTHTSVYEDRFGQTNLKLVFLIGSFFFQF